MFLQLWNQNPVGFVILALIAFACLCFVFVMPVVLLIRSKPMDPNVYAKLRKRAYDEGYRGLG